MYQYEFFDPDFYRAYCDRRKFDKRGPEERVPGHFVTRNEVELVRSSFWAEHCLHCGEPECFDTCPLFVPRADMRCLRLPFGMKNASEFPEFTWHCELAFEQWGKIETGLFPGAFTMDEADARENYWRNECGKQWLAMQTGALSEILCPIEVRKGFWYEKFRNAAHAGTVRDPRPAEFLLQLYSYEHEPFCMVLELMVDKAKRVKHREEFPVEPGFNQFYVDLGEQLSSDERKWTRLHPDQDHPGHVVLLFAEYVRLADGARERLMSMAQ